MNAEQLLTHFDRIADAPDAIPRLRRFILDLAVRGKLVEQDPNDEPAAELLKRIAAEKVQLVREKRISRQVSFLPPDLSEIPFDLPDSWEWCPSTYPSYGVSDKGKKVQTKDIVETGKFPVVDQGKVPIRGYHNDPSKVIRIEAPIVLFGDHTREVKLIDFDFIVGADGVKLLQSVSLHAPYYFLALQWLPLKSRGYGRHFKLLKESFIPLPPLAEQHRIVAKVDELMALCDRLETARKERETTRNRLAAASLARLNAPDPAVFQSHTAFALDNLASLTTRPAQIKALRQTILDLAVRGKLVEQDPKDEPAAELVRQARNSMSLLVKSGEAVKMKAMNPLLKTDELFPVPQSWQWVRLGELSKLITKGSSPKWQGIEYVGEESGILFITSENVGSYTLMKMDKPKYVEAQFNQIEARSILQKGDILLNLVGASIGRSALFDLECTANINQAVALIRPINEDAHIVSSYLLHYLNSPVCINEMLGSRVINAQPNISLTDTRNFLEAIS